MSILYVTAQEASKQMKPLARFYSAVLAVKNNIVKPYSHSVGNKAYRKFI